MDKYCLTCNKKLELCKGVEPWNTDHMICPICNGTYNIFELEKCDCKYGHADGKCRWPTLKDRLNQPPTSERQALEQLQTMMPLSKHGLKRLLKCIKLDEKLKATRKKIQAAVAVQLKSVTFEEAKKQVEKSHEQISKKKSLS
jgi:hypothetical protein